MIQALLERGFAYCDARGQVYFEVAKFPRVRPPLRQGPRRARGRRARRRARGEEGSARLRALEGRRQAPDAVGSARGDGLGAAASGSGYRRLAARRRRRAHPRRLPGLAHRVLRDVPARASATVIDIHTGGEDNMFPHHECEIAQTLRRARHDGPGPPAPGRRHAAADVRAPVGARPAPARRQPQDEQERRHVLHRARSAGPRGRRLRRPRRAPARTPVSRRAGSPANVLRYALVSVPYSQPMSFGIGLLAQARANVERLQSRVDRLREKAGPGTGAVRQAVLEASDAARARLRRALADNLNMSRRARRALRAGRRR